MSYKNKMTRLQGVCEAIISQNIDSDELIDDYISSMNTMLDNMLSDGKFGKNGELDPRGNQKQGKWSMSHVQEIDNEFDTTRH